MIVSLKSNEKIDEFEKLLLRSVSRLQSQAAENVDYYLSRKGNKLEEDVFDIVKENAKGTIFDGKIRLISGQKFPDIVAYIAEQQGYGLEVKTTSQNHWKTTGSSIFESTRVEGIERIYLLFGKLFKPIEFRYRKYEECLYDVAITHSPRYLVDMDTPSKSTIFDKINITYDDLRQLNNPFAPIKQYLRTQIKEGEDVWWVDREEETIGNINVRLWGNIEQSEKIILRNQAMALFPQMFGNNTKKYSKVATWLAARHGIVSPSLRDTFTAGGQVILTVGGIKYENIPKIFQHLQSHAHEITSFIKECSTEDLLFYWESKISENSLDQWIELVASHAQESLRNSNLDVITLLYEAIGKQTV